MRSFRTSGKILLTNWKKLFSNSGRVSKTALLGLCRVLSQELASMDIRVNCVCPGVVKTKFAGAILEMEEELSGQFSMKRFAEPHEISGIVSFLADEDRASYITGENFTVCGGGNFRL